MGLIIEHFTSKISAEVRSKSFRILDEIGGEIELDWEKLDDLKDILNTIEQHKPNP